MRDVLRYINKKQTSELSAPSNIFIVGENPICEYVTEIIIYLFILIHIIVYVLYDDGDTVTEMYFEYSY